MKNICFAWLCLLPFLSEGQSKIRATPDKVYGQLFTEVQLQKILPDGKTFVDCTPKRKAAEIMDDYSRQKGDSLNLKKFVADNFNLPVTPQLNYIQKERDPAMHIKNLWSVLKTEAGVTNGSDTSETSLLPLPNAYIVPGGRFREIHYWDSYFIMLGLKENGEVEMIENMVKNFAALIDTYGYIPAGNRTYYLSRSQPPFFCLMVELLAEIKGKAVYKTYLPAMEKEYAYWMDGTATATKEKPVNRVVTMADGSILNRYWDDTTIPRPENYKEDFELSEAVAQELAMRIKVASPEKLQAILNNSKANANRNLRAGACSGWDFSSRWFADPQKLSTIQTTSIVPVDLNCLIYSMETIIARALKLNGNATQANLYNQKAARRKAAVLKYCWSKPDKFFFDYDLAAGQQSTVISVAGIFPLFVKIATPAQAAAVAKSATSSLLKPGGIVTTAINSGQQWDAPNGWAPLQWVAITGFKNNGNSKLAATIATRWLALNEKVYGATGKMMDKYNVEDMNQPAADGEYTSQDGFGWTNGVYLALKKIYNQ